MSDDQSQLPNLGSVLCEEVRRIAEDGRYAAAVAIGVDEGRSVETIASRPGDLPAQEGPRRRLKHDEIGRTDLPSPQPSPA